MPEESIGRARPRGTGVVLALGRQSKVPSSPTAVLRVSWNWGRPVGVGGGQGHCSPDNYLLAPGVLELPLHW